MEEGETGEDIKRGDLIWNLLFIRRSCVAGKQNMATVLEKNPMECGFHSGQWNHYLT